MNKTKVLTNIKLRELRKDAYTLSLQVDRLSLGFKVELGENVEKVANTLEKMAKFLRDPESYKDVHIVKGKKV